MDAAPPPRTLAGPTRTSLTANRPSPLPDIVSAWPRCAQLAGAFLLGGLTALLGVHAFSYFRDGTEPAALQEPQSVTYRVDLNDARRAELLQLPGVGPSLADWIEEYRKANGGFASVDELRKVPGIGPATLEKLRPFVSVRAPVAKLENKGTAAPEKATAKKPKDPVDINTASLAELQTLPGIGPKLSQRIVDERERKLFANVDELRRVAGIGPKTLEKIKPYCTVGGK